MKFHSGISKCEKAHHLTIKKKCYQWTCLPTKTSKQDP